MSIIATITGLASSASTIALGVCGIGFLIGFHELGHFLFCKLFGIRTPSFSIGMGPRIFTKKIGDTEFALSAIPLGGYVEIAGAAEVGQGDQKEAHASDYGSFKNRPYYQKFLVMMGGIGCNMLFAYIALSALYFVGAPKSGLLYHHAATTTIQAFEPETTTGLQIGDTIVAINNVNVRNNVKELATLVKSMPNTVAHITIERNGTQEEIETTIGSKTIDNKEFGSLGITDFVIPRYGLFESIKKGIATTHELALHVITAFKAIFQQRDASQVGGPLMVLKQTIDGAGKGLKIFTLLLAFISVNLAIMNLIPLPIMDGGQLLFYTIEATIRRPLPDNIREYIHIATWIMILVLVVILTFKDLITIFW